MCSVMEVSDYYLPLFELCNLCRNDLRDPLAGVSTLSLPEMLNLHKAQNDDG